MDLRNAYYTLTLKTDPEQALTHLIIAEEGAATERTSCGTEPDELHDAELPIDVGLLCPGCFLYFTRTLAAHFNLPLQGPPGLGPTNADLERLGF